MNKCLKNLKNNLSKSAQKDLQCLKKFKPYTKDLLSLIAKYNCKFGLVALKASCGNLAVFIFMLFVFSILASFLPFLCFYHKSKYRLIDALGLFMLYIALMGILANLISSGLLDALAGTIMAIVYGAACIFTCFKTPSNKTMILLSDGLSRAIKSF